MDLCMVTKHILTWNVDWFRNGNRSGRPEEYFEEDSSIEVYTSIVNIIKNFFENDAAIVFLQEVPFKVKGHDHFLFKQLYKDFPKKVYDIFVNEKFAYRCTIAISKKDVFERADIGSLADNRTVAVQKDGITFIGTHMPTGFRRNDDNCKKWDSLLSFIKRKESGIFVCGDFNAYVGCNDKLTEEYYLKLLNYMDNYIDELKTTFIRQTSIDKILLLKKEMGITVDGVKVQDIFELSDHRYATVEINNRK